MSKNELTIGTRGSLLATAQSEMIRMQLEKISKRKISLKFIKTQGDEITNAPLWQLDGKDFFTKELDSALISREVDLLVHSYKDLATQRPDKIILGAVTKRSYPEDILLIPRSKVSELSSLKKVCVGTSAPRRIELFQTELSKFLPHHPQVDTKILRGNVNTRIEKLLENQYDAIVLAMAGLERLSQDPKAKLILQELVKELCFIILPPSEFPPAAAQGALAIEYLQDSPIADQLNGWLKQLHHDETAEVIQRERSAFLSYGGGCHLPMGIHVRKCHEHFLHIHKGKEQGSAVHKIWLEDERPLIIPHKVFIGLPKSKSFLNHPNIFWDEYCIKKERSLSQDLNGTQIFVTSSYSAKSISKSLKAGIWASGSQTWKMLTAKGHFIQGSSDGLGHDYLNHLASSSFLSFFLGERSTQNWKVLTHDNGSSPLGECVSAYERNYSCNLDFSFWEQIKSCGLFYWTSYSQFLSYKEKIPSLLEAKHIHCCGMGKTYDALKDNGIKVIPIPQLQSFKEIIQNHFIRKD